MNNIYRINLPVTRPYCRIFIADQHQLMVFAFRRLLDNHPHLKVVGSSGSGLEAMRLCRRQSPTLVIVDPYLAEINGLDFIRMLKRRIENIKVIAYFSHRDDDKLSSFVDAGVDGIVDKSSSIGTLLKAIHCVNGGGRFFDNIRVNDKEWVLDLTDVADSGLLPKISVRERQILKLIAEGQRNKGIASLLSISVKTVESHRFNLMKKLDAHSIADLVSWARKYNVL
jgi:two-component system secretion response regulator SsrB